MDLSDIRWDGTAVHAGGHICLFVVGRVRHDFEESNLRYSDDVI